MIIDETKYLEHYGTPRHSGRYPWGSGGDANLTRHASFLDTVDELRAKGVSDSDIAKGMNISLTELRSKRTVARAEVTMAKATMAQRLRDKGYSYTAISERMGLAGESSVRALLAPGVKERAQNVTQVASMLKREVAEKKMIDIGSGVETHINLENKIGVSKEKLNAGVSILKDEGYVVHPIYIKTGPNQYTQMKVLCPPGTPLEYVQKNREQVQQIKEFSNDGGRSFGRIHEPISISPNRVKVNYQEDGGDKADGVIYVREGVDDISLGNSRYAQVRIKVGEGHYLKGMAMYKSDLPPGADLVFNTNKSKNDPKIMGNKLKAMKELEPDPEFPFGSVVRQITADTGTPKERVTSAMNLITEEGQWGGWNKNLSSQVLSKQSPTLAKEQLTKTYAQRRKELDEINALTNPVVKKKLLEKSADSFDNAAVHLKAAALSTKDRWQVILPIDSMPPTQVYAPNFDNGTRVALIRYPHGGTFEIPELTVNNKHPQAKKLLGQAQDAVGIHHSVAQRLSGADFDGDTVLVVPNNQGKIRTTRALDDLKGFDPIKSYPGYEGMKKMSKETKQMEMGKVSNLITDMTLRGAPQEHIARAIKHSMVVIDAEKHGLNYKQSAIDNNISQLKREYQGKPNAGAATLISRKKQTTEIPERRLRRESEGGPIDPKTGRKVYVPTGATRRGKDGPVSKTVKIKRLELVEDAHELSSGTPMERLYADHSNRLKSLANEARLAARNTPPLKYSTSAKKIYAKEVETLNAKLTLAKMNRPKERQARLITNARVKAIRDAHPGLDEASLKKLEYRELQNVRDRLGAKAERFEITQREWDAIQQGAISNNVLEQIIDKANLDTVRKLATPRRKKLLSTNDQARARVLLSRGATRAEVAKALGVSISTLDRSTE